MAANKPTNKERDQQIGWLTAQINNLNYVLGVYIEWNSDGNEFKKHLIDVGSKLKKEQEKKNDTSNPSKMDSKEG